MEAYEGIMNSTRAPFSILPKPIDEDGNTVTTTGGADDDRYPLVPEEATIVAAWQQLLNKATAYPRSVLWNKVKILEPLVALGYNAFNGGLPGRPHAEAIGVGLGQSGEQIR